MEVVKNKEKKEQINPKDYAYTGQEDIVMKSSLFKDISRGIADALHNETKIYYPEKYDWVNEKTGKIVKKPKKEDIDSGAVYKILSVERTLQGEPQISRTPLGQYLLQLTVMLEQQHIKNIEDGNAVSVEELEKKSKEMKAKLEELSKEK